MKQATDHVLCDCHLCLLYTYIWGTTLKGKHLLPHEQIISFKSRQPPFRDFFSYKEENMFTKLFPFVQEGEKHEGVSRG